MLDLTDSDGIELFVDVKVRKPKLEDFSYTSYEITIETNNYSFQDRRSSVRRRYSEFEALHKILTKEFPAIKVPALPPKLIFSDHFHAAFIEKRRQGLEEFLEKLVSQKIFLSSKALHLFLQSSYTMDEIKDIIQGKEESIPENQLQNESLSNGFSIFYASSNSSTDSTDPVSSQTKTLVNENTAVAASGSSSTFVPKESSNTSPMGSKKVSFCEKVTVAQIHVD